MATDAAGSVSCAARYHLETGRAAECPGHWTDRIVASHDMDILKFFGGHSRFVSADAHATNLAKQVTMTPLTLEQLRKCDVTDDRELKLEFFFYTNSKSKAEALAAALDRLGYQTEARPSAGNPKQYVITGWTLPMKMSVDVVSTWTKEMCELGYEHDCDFDGWGTTPSQ